MKRKVHRSEQKDNEEVGLFHPIKTKVRVAWSP